MAEELEHDPTLPPAGEAIHMPEPSYLPAVLALGITIALVGIIQGLALIVIGVLIILTVLVRWIRSAREEMNDLPLDHSAH
jgi:phosphoglycerol transferase MdoB-like AlkP superfamily enzyme